MRDVEIPDWLEELPLAPEFHPTDTEFADPIAYISKIEREAGAFGICKVVPPLPKPSKKYVLANLNRSLSKSPELGSDVRRSVEGRPDGAGAVFTTRHQELGYNGGRRARGAALVPPPPAPVHKQVWQSGEIYTLEQFESKSKTFARSQLGVAKEAPPLAVETLFWQAAQDKPIYIEYANDVPGSGFGEPVGPFRLVRRRRRRAFHRNDRECLAANFEKSQNLGEATRCSSSSSVAILKKETDALNMVSDRDPRQSGPNGSHETEGTSGWKLSNSPWNLQVIARSPGSLTRFMPDDIPGVTSPMVYIGMLFSWFAWHVEDHELHSLNFLHMGSPKTWYAVPGEYAYTFEEVIRSKAYGSGIDRLAALTLLGEKTTLLSPETVVASGIPCCRLVQNPGEFVVTFPRAYHIGFSHGFNCGEAANFGTPKWLEVAKEAAVRRAAMNFLPMLSHQHLLYLLTMSFIPRVPRSLLPGVRSSRLRDRQKEERERLVKTEFVEDILNENKLLTRLLRRNPLYRSVLWDLESLPPSLTGAPDSNHGAVGNTAAPPPENGGSSDKFSDDIETLIHMEDDDMSSDFQVDSGTLPCVACGVLGFPFMAVLQPSVKVGIRESGDDTVRDGVSDGKSSMDKTSSDRPNIASSVTEVVDAEERIVEAPTGPTNTPWHTSDRFLRPRIFCLEHANKTERLLSSKGGARLLVICHSDFRKVRAQAAVIAEQIGRGFGYTEVELERANGDDLDLINLAIDDERGDGSAEDWTTELNVNLRQSVKLGNKSSGDRVNYALALDALFPDTTTTTISGQLILPWQSRKPRSNRKSNRKSVSDSVSAAKAETSRKEGTLIQYTRRIFKSKGRDCVAGVGTDTNENGSLALGDLSTTEKSDTRLERRIVVEKPVPSVAAVEVSDTTPAVENAEAQSDNQASAETEGGYEGPEGRFGHENSTGSVTSASQSVESSETEKENASEEETSDKNEGSDLETEGDSGGSCGNETAMGSDVQDRVTHGNDESTPVSSSSSGSKRKREVEPRRDDGFVRSPCEGLRPRGGKHPHKSQAIEMTKTPPQKPVKKTKPSKKVEKGPHWCDQEGCRLSFQTKAELSLHRRNQCPHQGCRKKFSSHRYAVLHVRVHEDHRPLKCSWKGCKMTFKWAWARTEHLRVHTGERPYKCTVDGCDRTFRFVSDFSRHRRKTGHYVNVKA